MDDVTLGPGKETDALVAERVMGWTWTQATADGMGWVTAKGRSTKYVQGGSSMAGGYGRSFQPSTDIAAAWEVVEELRSRGIMVFVRVRPDAAHVHVEPDDWQAAGWWAENATADTAPLAICMAALKAVERTP